MKTILAIFALALAVSGQTHEIVTEVHPTPSPELKAVQEYCGADRIGFVDVTKCLAKIIAAIEKLEHPPNVASFASCTANTPECRGTGHVDDGHTMRITPDNYFELQHATEHEKPMESEDRTSFGHYKVDDSWTLKAGGNVVLEIDRNGVATIHLGKFPMTGVWNSPGFEIKSVHIDRKDGSEVSIGEDFEFHFCCLEPSGNLKGWRIPQSSDYAVMLQDDETAWDPKTMQLVSTHVDPVQALPMEFPHVRWRLDGWYYNDDHGKISGYPFVAEIER